MRSLTWSSIAAFIVAAIGLAVPLIVVSVMLTNLPTPQFTYGEMFAPLQRSEIMAGISPVSPEANDDRSFPPRSPRRAPSPSCNPSAPSARPISVTFFLCLALGAASLPSLLLRSGVTSSVADQRRSVAWAVLFVALFAATAPALAAFARLLIFQDITQHPASALPSWLNDLSAYHLLTIP